MKVLHHTYVDNSQQMMPSLEFVTPTMLAILSPLLVRLDPLEAIADSRCLAIVASLTTPLTPIQLLNRRDLDHTVLKSYL